MPDPRNYDLKVALPSGTTLQVKCETLNRMPGNPLMPGEPLVGDLDYRVQNPLEGIPWDLSDFSRGCGAFLHERGRYAIAQNADCRFGHPMPGPRRIDDYTGIAANVQVRGRYRYGTTDWLWTDDATNNVYRRRTGESAWSAVATGVSQVVTTIVGLKGVIAVGYSTANAFRYTSDPDANTPTFTTSTKAALAKNMTLAIADMNVVTAPRIIYVVDPNEVYFTEDLTNAGASTTSSVVGDSSNDEFNSLVLDPAGVLYFGKRHQLYSMDSQGQVRPASKRFAYKANADGDTARSTRNFADPVVMPDNRVYYRVEDYKILELYRGVIQEITPGIFGPDTAVMQLPCTALCVVGDYLVAALGTKSSTLIDVSKFPAGAQLLANTIAQNTAYLFFGQYRDYGHGPEWIWHGYLQTAPFVVGYMWYAEDLKRLFLCAASDQTVNNAQKQLVITPGNPLLKPDGGNILLHPDDWFVETGLFTNGRPNITKLARRFEARMSGLATGDPVGTIKYRIAEDDDTSTGFTTLASYTSASAARDGTAFPASVTFKGMRLQIGVTDDGDASEYTYGVFYNGQLTFLDFSPVKQRLEADFLLTNGSVNLGGAQTSTSMKELVNALVEWQDATDTVTVTDLETGESWAMRLEPGWPVIAGTSKTRKAKFIAHEVA